MKWILPPQSSSHYASEKAFAESMGYQTVEFDDPTYPRGLSRINRA